MQDLVADTRVVVHHLALILRQRTGLGEDGIGNADLADIVHRRRQAQLLDPLGVQPHGRGNQRRRLADAQDMVAGLVVLVAGGPRQAANHRLEAGTQLLGTLLHALLQLITLLLQGLTGQAQAQVVAHAQQQLRQVQGLADVVVGAQLQAAAALVDAIEGGDDDHRRAAAVAAGQLLQDLEAIRRRHVQVQQQQVPGIGLQPGQAFGGVAEGLDLTQAKGLEAGLQQAQVGAHIVDHHHGGKAQHIRQHRS